MIDFVRAILAPHNLVLSILLGLCALYWCLVIVGGLALELFDSIMEGFFDFSPDIDPDTGMEVEVTDAGAFDVLVGTLVKVYNVGYVPLSVIGSLLLLFTWAASLLSHRWVQDWPYWQQALVVPVAFVVATLVNKVLTTPLKAVFGQSHRKVAAPTLEGLSCVLTTSAAETRPGQAEVQADHGRFLTVSVLAAPGQGSLDKGQRALIVGPNPDGSGYLVKKPDSPVSAGAKS